MNLLVVVATSNIEKRSNANLSTTVDIRMSGNSVTRVYGAGILTTPMSTERDVSPVFTDQNTTYHIKFKNVIYLLSLFVSFI